MVVFIFDYFTILPSVWCSGVLGGEVERDGGLRSKGGQTQPGYANGAQWYIRAPSSAA